MRKLMFGGAWLVLGLIGAAGCGKGDAPAPAGTTAATGAAGDSTGVAECDDYFAKMKACYEKNPAAKASMEATMGQMREMFKTMAANPQGKDQLKAQCTEHIKLLGQNPMCK